jgi:hypothetical protein
VNILESIKAAKDLDLQCEQARATAERLEDEANKAAAGCRLLVQAYDSSAGHIAFMPIVAEGGGIKLGICLDPRVDQLRERDIRPTVRFDTDSIRRIRNYLNEILGE